MAGVVRAEVPSCTWSVYDGARGEPTTLFTDPDATPPFMMRTSGDFLTGSSVLSESGGIDFDGDGRTDPFRVTTRPDGAFQWQHVSGALPEKWEDMAYAGDPFLTLRFGDFDADGKTDVFTTSVTTSSVGPSTHFMYSSGGVGSYETLKSVGGGQGPLAFGRFDGDSKTDVFESLLDGSSFDFIYSAGGVLDFSFLSTQNSVQPSFLRYGDFDGDLRTDVLQVSDLGDSTSFWVYFPGGKKPPVTLGTRPVALQDIQFGDFDGDGKTDPFTTRALPDGRLEWIYWPAGIGDPIVLNTVDGPVPQLGEFVGDGRTDAMVIRCGAEPVIAPLPELDVVKVPQSVFQHFIGDVTGDGIPDVVRYSRCQNRNQGSFFCGASANLVQTAIADGHGGFSDTTNLQVLFSGISLDLAALQLIDVNGDGLADLVWLNPVASGLDVYVATAVGDGSFAETPKQALSMPPGFANPSLRDLNGDGRADIIWTTVCTERTGFDSTGCGFGDDNKVLAALAGPGGTFAVSSPQSLGAATGWKSFGAFEGDVNGDGNVDVIFNSTCQKTNVTDAKCTSGGANFVYVALGDGKGRFALGPRQTYESTGWDNFTFTGVVDLNGDGLDDLVWIKRCDDRSSFCQGSATLVVRVGLAAGDGTFDVTPPDDLGFGYWPQFDIERGDMDGDGKIDLLLYGVGRNARDSAAVYVLFSDGSGGFTPSAMQLLSGRGWHGFSFRPLAVGDVTGDGKDELTWFDTTPVDHDRVIVSGDVAAITATTTTTISEPTTTTIAGTGAATTTTTLPDCRAQAGLSGVQCFCAAPVAPAVCAGAALPARLTNGFSKACGLLGRVATGSPKAQKKLLGKMAARLGGLAKTASKRAIAKKLPPGCSSTLRDQLSLMRADARTAHQSIGH